MPALVHVEGADVMGEIDEIGAGRLIGAGVGNIENALIRREGESVRLVERVRDHRGLARRRVVTVDEGADLRRRFKALHLAVIRIGEPHRAV